MCKCESCDDVSHVFCDSKFATSTSFLKLDVLERMPIYHTTLTKSIFITELSECSSSLRQTDGQVVSEYKLPILSVPGASRVAFCCQRGGPRFSSRFSARTLVRKLSFVA